LAPWHPKLFDWSDEITADGPRKQARNLNDPMSRPVEGAVAFEAIGLFFPKPASFIIMAKIYACRCKFLTRRVLWPMLLKQGYLLTYHSQQPIDRGLLASLEAMTTQLGMPAQQEGPADRTIAAGRRVMVSFMLDLGQSRAPHAIEHLLHVLDDKGEGHDIAVAPLLVSDESPVVVSPPFARPMHRRRLLE
jgi:hypothetical protein